VERSRSGHRAFGDGKKHLIAKAVGRAVDKDVEAL
jgi:hypothetical protein